MGGQEGQIKGGRRRENKAGRGEELKGQEKEKKPFCICILGDLKCIKKSCCITIYAHTSSLLKAHLPGCLSGTRTMHLILERNKQPFSLTAFSIRMRSKLLIFI